MAKGNIERLRGERGLSAATLADLAGIPTTTWYRRMQKPTSFTLGELIDVAKALRVSVGELVS